MNEFDFTILGGGLFGVYTAIYLAKKNFKVCLIEKEKALFTKASVINQARLHEGYHYPRSMATASLSQYHKEKFNKDHADFINTQYESFYGIDKFDSVTNDVAFEKFCREINIPATRIDHFRLFNEASFQALYRTQEYSFDPIKLSRYYIEKIRSSDNITILTATQMLTAENLTDKWKIDFQVLDDVKIQTIITSAVVNATYSGINGINAIFGLSSIGLFYELSELAFIKSEALQNTSLTIIDGPFASYAPYGLSGLITLSSVPFTHHKKSLDVMPTFDCQLLNHQCKPDFIYNCNMCSAAPMSNHEKMLDQIKKYLTQDVPIDYVSSSYAIKAKLVSSTNDDSRPTELIKLSTRPGFYCLFSGKINSIYEVDKIFSTL